MKRSTRLLDPEIVGLKGLMHFARALSDFISPLMLNNVQKSS